MLVCCVYCRAKKWIVKIRRRELDGVALLLIQKCYMCSSHFEDNAYMCPELRHSTSRLNWNALPSIWNHENPSVDSRFKPRKQPMKRQPLPTSKTPRFKRCTSRPAEARGRGVVTPAYLFCGGHNVLFLHCDPAEK